MNHPTNADSVVKNATKNKKKREVLVLEQYFCIDERILHTCFHSRTYGQGHSTHVAAMDYSNIERHIADDLKTTGQQRYNRLYAKLHSCHFPTA